MARSKALAAFGVAFCTVVCDPTIADADSCTETFARIEEAVDKAKSFHVSIASTYRNGPSREQVEADIVLPGRLRHLWTTSGITFETIVLEDGTALTRGLTSWTVSAPDMAAMLVREVLNNVVPLQAVATDLQCYGIVDIGGARAEKMSFRNDDILLGSGSTSAAELWVDALTYLPIRLLIDGSRPFDGSMMKVQQRIDYRFDPGIAIELPDELK